MGTTSLSLPFKELLMRRHCVLGLGLMLVACTALAGKQPAYTYARVGSTWT